MMKRSIVAIAAALSLSGAAYATVSKANAAVAPGGIRFASSAPLADALESGRPFTIRLPDDPSASIGARLPAIKTAVTPAAPIYDGYVTAGPYVTGYPSTSKSPGSKVDNVLAIALPSPFVSAATKYIEFAGQFYDYSYNGPLSVTFTLVAGSGSSLAPGTVISTITESGTINDGDYYSVSGPITRPAFRGPATIYFSISHLSKSYGTVSESLYFN
jgi:hypothetical protein